MVLCDFCGDEMIRVGTLGNNAHYECQSCGHETFEEYDDEILWEVDFELE